MTQKKIGKLTLLNREMQRNHALWRCRCDCGREKTFSEELLFSGVISSCGLKRCGQILLNPGMKIGKLTLIHQINDRQSVGQKWLCRCECGLERTVYQRYLLDGSIISCGCDRYELASGVRIGRLTVLNPVVVNGRKKWQCRCDCGNEITCFSATLLSGKVSSCGCYGIHVGDRFGKLLVLRRADSGRFLCRCDCGKEKMIFAKNLASGKVLSCGDDRLIHPGDRFDRWTAVEPREGIYWLCHCDCGNERVVRMSDLLSGKSRSCGCLHRLPAGQRFGNLTVLEDRGSMSVLCRCDCGRKRSFPRASLRSGAAVNCGCIEKNKIPCLVSEGDRFGKLTVIRVVSKDSVICRCDCGKEKEILVASLRRGRVHSCGCAKGRQTRLKVGDRYGRLVVLELTENGRCICQCDCGNKAEILRRNLVTGNTSSCGCLHTAGQHNTPVPGAVYGNLTVLEVLNSNICRCKCSCGRIKLMHRKELINGGVQSCGLCPRKIRVKTEGKD